MSTLTIAVFSFNRGYYLRNCIESIRQLAPEISVLVIDDASDDVLTRDVLNSLPETVFHVSTTDKARHGGLYTNMNLALAEAKTDFIMFVQDDMQMVRPINDLDIALISNLFEENSAIAFICPLFMKASSLYRYRRALSPHPTLRAYQAKVKGRNTISYFDANIGHVKRLRMANWSFGPTEKAMMQAAGAQFGAMPFMGDPILFFCPEVPIYRNRGRSLASKIASRVVGDDVKSLEYLSKESNENFISRSLSDWPVAEQWLVPQNSAVRRPFVYKNVNARLWLRVLYRMERLLQKLSR